MEEARHREKTSVSIMKSRRATMISQSNWFGGVSNIASLLSGVFSLGVFSLLPYLVFNDCFLVFVALMMPVLAVYHVILLLFILQ